jgi:hypothetical protein
MHIMFQFKYASGHPNKYTTRAFLKQFQQLENVSSCRHNLKNRRTGRILCALLS